MTPRPFIWSIFGVVKRMNEGCGDHFSRPSFSHRSSYFIFFHRLGFTQSLSYFCLESFTPYQSVVIMIKRSSYADVTLMTLRIPGFRQPFQFTNTRIFVKPSTMCKPLRYFIEYHLLKNVNTESGCHIFFKFRRRWTAKDENSSN